MLLFAPVILFAPPRLQVLVAAVFAGMVLTYPMLRGAGLVPTDAIHTLAQSVSEERAGSLKYRLDNEDMLLARANEKPLAGWGSWGRNRVYDPETGRDLSVTDGLWVIMIGSFGWIGYVAQFGLLTMPLLILARRRGAEIAPVTAGIAVLTAAALIDLIPNATLTPVTWIVAGALAGQAIRTGSPRAGSSPATAAAHDRKWISGSVSGPLYPVKPSRAEPSSKWAGTPIPHRRAPRLSPILLGELCTTVRSINKIGIYWHVPYVNC